MLPETAYIKLMWVLANSRNDEEATRLMTTDLRGEMADRRELDG
jgi:glutamyl-tRNA(Gln) amidotransferase subunit D